MTRGGSTEITLCAEVAGLTNLSQSLPPWINEKIAGMLRVNWAHMNLVIQDDEGQIIYGHEVLKRLAQTGMTPEVNTVRGILPECFITYVSRRFPEVKEVRDLVASNEINYKLFEAVSDRIQNFTLHSSKRSGIE